MRFWELVKLALASVRRTPLRVALTSLGVAIATGALVSMLAFARGLQLSAEKPFEKLDLLNQIEVSPKSGDDEEGTNAGPAGPILDDSAVDRMASLPGVRLAYPQFSLGGIQAIRGEKTQMIFATGLPPQASRLGFVKDLMIAGRFFDAGGSNEVILGRRLAKKLGFASPREAVGQKLHLKVRGLSPGSPALFTLEKREYDVEVVGVLDPPGWLGEIAGEGMIVPLETIKKMPGVRFEPMLHAMRRGKSPRPGEHGRASVRVERPSDLTVVEKRIQEMGFETHTLIGQVKEMRKFFVLIDVLLAAVGCVALVVAGLGIINTLLMSVLERYGEIGTYKAIGASDGDVRILFLAEAGLVGLLGGAGGLVLGRAVSWLIDLGVNAYARTKGVEQPIAAFAFPLWLLAGALAFAVVASVASGVYPASRAARVDPIRALRGE